MHSYPDHQSVRNAMDDATENGMDYAILISRILDLKAEIEKTGVSTKRGLHHWPTSWLTLGLPLAYLWPTCGLPLGLPLAYAWPTIGAPVAYYAYSCINFTSIACDL